MILDFEQALVMDFTDEPIVEREAFKDSDGSLHPPVYLMQSKAASNMLMEDKADDPIKLYEIARSLYREGKVTIDTSDLDLVERTIKQSKRFSPIVVAQVLLKIKEQRSKGETNAAH